MATRRLPGTPGRIISFIRNVLIGRSVTATPWLRTPAVCSIRSPDPPNLPEGIAHKLAFNYYYSRDSRRAVEPPTIAASYNPLLTQSKNSDTDTKTKDSDSQTEDHRPVLTMPAVPGVGHKWSQIG